jgi:cobalt/nickel transport system permease protein
MAHIQDGILSAPVLIGGAVLALGASAMALRRATDSDIPRAAVLASILFAGSSIAVPVGPSSVHLMFSALMGLVLGWLAVPAVLAVLILQLVLFGFGGVTTLGINAFNIALPGVLFGLVLRRPLTGAPAGRAALLAGLAGGLAALATGGLVALSLALSASDFVPAARVMALTYLPLALVEAVICGAAVGYLQRALPGRWLAVP